MNQEAKRAVDSEVVMAEVMLPTHANPAGNVHGGEIMKIMDNAAAVVAFRHSRCNCVTVSVQDIVFKHPIYVGNLVETHAKLLYVRKSSMLIGVKMLVEDMLRGERREAINAFFTMVALDPGGKTTEIPRLIIESEKDKANYAIALEKYEESKARAKTEWIL
jgi:acyl-CoA hydrolase